MFDKETGVDPEIDKSINLSIARENERLARVAKVARSFAARDKTIQEVSKETGISSSTVQRDLNDEKRIIQTLGFDIYTMIQDKLKQNKVEGLSRGGKVTQSRYYQIRDDIGKYKGNVKMK